MLFEVADLRRGDILEVGAKYDTSKRDFRADDPMVWRLGTSDVMLMTFVLVNPRPPAMGSWLVNLCR